VSQCSETISGSPLLPGSVEFDALGLKHSLCSYEQVNAPIQYGNKLDLAAAYVLGLARMASQDRKLALTFGVFHGRVIQIMEGKVPIVHGRGYSIDGWGGTRIQTDVVRDGEVWLKDHQTGRDHHFKLGSEYPPMLPGHDVTILEVNRQRYAVANHNTGVLQKYSLTRAVGPYKSAIGGCATAILALIVVPVVLINAIWMLVVFFPSFVYAIAPTHHWTRPEVYGLLFKLIMVGIPVASFATWLFIRSANRKVRAHNAKLDAELGAGLSAAVNQHINSYRLLR